MLTLNRVKRLGILLLTILVLTWCWKYLVKYRPWDIRFPVKKKLSSADYEFHKARIREVSGELTYFDIKSEKLEINKESAILKQVSGNMLNKNLPVIFFKADNMLLNTRNQRATLSGVQGHTIKTSFKTVRRRVFQENTPVWQIKSPLAYWSHHLNTLTMDKPVKIWKDDISLTADRLIYYSQYQFFILEPNCEIKDKDYQIYSKKATLKEKLSTLTMENNVSFQGAELNGRADSIEINYENGEYTFKKDIVIEYEGAAINTNLITTQKESHLLNMSEGVKFVYKNILIQSNKAQLNRVLKTITFFENIKAWQDQNQLAGEKIIYDLKEKKFVSTGGRTKFIKVQESD